MTSPASSAPGTGHEVARPPGKGRDSRSSTSKPALPSAAEAASPASPAPRIATLGEALIVSPGGMLQGRLSPRQNVRAGSVIRDRFLQSEHHTGGIPGFATFAEGGKAGFDVWLANGGRGEHADFFMQRRDGTLFEVAKLFVKLFARARARELNSDVFIRTQSGENNQIARQIHDAHRVAHIEHEHLTAAPHRRSLQDELACLWNRHEETLHFRMRYRYRAAREDLLFELRHHAAVAAEHVA